MLITQITTYYMIIYINLTLMIIVLDNYSSHIAFFLESVISVKLVKNVN